MTTGQSSFALVAQAVAAHRWGPGIAVEEIPAPGKIAPDALAIAATYSQGDDELADGRLVVLHDARGNESWEGDYRCVSFIHAEVDPEMGADPLLTEVGWSWLIDALEGQQARFQAESGTVTTSNSKGFGDLQDGAAEAAIEIRASWTPVIDEPADIGAHLRAWAELLRLAAGMPELPESVVPFSRVRA